MKIHQFYDLYICIHYVKTPFPSLGVNHSGKSVPVLFLDFYLSSLGMRVLSRS